MESREVYLSIPSSPGFERVAMAAAAELLRLKGAGEEAARDLAAAVGEACLNAMEHGHGFDPRLQVQLNFRVADGCLQVAVQDAGPSFILPEREPSLRNKIEGGENPRGWGLYLIKKLVDRVELQRYPGGNRLLLTKKLPES
ncbi:ATP-binding protein [Desulfotomaculum copahuensis]|uniref:Histidine kinase/HSP90-like ATPase domain-containing protein n=1 Tax=Desulfotomaculum copahuensis TaxID=1838280 RepID=A0A1B7LCH3_9FIRM|nr:ATP-binding protein [Desulfotomaculum copahuensis]OAT80360.1 hypothetical protein A6M21_13395 [Desulfotomaculum copahuensis]